jgi:hypothetical protein
MVAAHRRFSSYRFKTKSSIWRRWSRTFKNTLLWGNKKISMGYSSIKSSWYNC